MLYFVMLPHVSTIEEIKQNYLKGKDTINIYVDLRNSFPVFFDEDKAAILIKDIEASLLTGIESAVSFMDYIIQFFNEYKVTFSFFYDVGRSEYHNSLNKEYKQNRKGTYLSLKPDQIESIEDLNQKFFSLFDKFINNFKNCKCYSLNYFESDFAPYYIIHDLKGIKKNELDIIISNDKDLYQLLDPDLNIIQLKKYFRIRSTKIIDFNNMYEDLTKREIDITSKENYISDILALSGDTSDNIKGLNRVGYVTSLKFFKSVDMKLQDILKYSDIDDFKNKTKITDAKILKIVEKIYSNRELVETNLKLVSFDIIKEHVPIKQKLNIRKMFESDSFDLDSVVQDLNLFEKDYSSLLIKLFELKSVDQFSTQFKEYIKNKVASDNEYHQQICCSVTEDITKYL